MTADNTDGNDGHWEHFPHEADIGVRGSGPTRAQAFEQAALAMTAAITDLESVAALEAITISCEAANDEMLLVDWLNALIYEMATRKMVFGRFQVELEYHQLRATAWGEPVDVAKHEPAVEIKGATYTALAVEQNKNGDWTAQTVVDV